MSRPIASIIIPCHNAAPWLAQTLESALAQTCGPREIILVDDGSTDESLAIARTFEPRGVTVLHQANAGASAARNHGLARATGGYVQFLDADDLLAPDKIAIQLAALASAPALTLAAGRWGRFREDPAQAEWPDEDVYRATTGVEFLQLHFETYSMMQPGAWLAPRELLKLAGPWDESLSLNDDGEYFARVMLRARSILPTPAARAYYRQPRAGSLSRRRGEAALRSLHRSVRLTLQHLRAADDSDRTRAACNLAWRRIAAELYPDAPDLARDARRRAREFGGDDTPCGVPGWVAQLARVAGWSFARRLQRLRNRRAGG